MILNVPPLPGAPSCESALADKVMRNYNVGRCRRARKQDRSAPLDGRGRYLGAGRLVQHQTLADTPDGLGIHALNFDIDIGPLLQVQKLLDSIRFARRKGITRELTAAELEMMNLTGDGNEFDMIDMPSELQPLITANFFQRAGYERNPVAIRHNTVASLLAATDAKMDKEASLPRALDMLRAFDAP
jgi:hypothetical protein